MLDFNVLIQQMTQGQPPAEMSVLASTTFQPTFGDNATTFEVNRFLGSTVPGANFAIGNGLGVAVVVEKTSPGSLTLDGAAFLRVHSVGVEFSARPRDESVTV